jgi:1-hydroxycarotenoid 3,4-desaturase
VRGDRVAVIGAGIGGLAAAVELAARGLDVTVVERAAAPGGKMREVGLGEQRLDAGPTVFTMRWVFDELFAAAGATFADHVALRPAGILARHAWDRGDRLDLFADLDRSADAIGAFAGPAEACGYRAFCDHAARTYRTFESTFIRAQRPSPVSLARDAGPAGLANLWRAQPFATLWSALGRYFQDPRLRQLFGRYATYCGSSPFQASATLALVAHVEQQGVWLVDGGMHQVAAALARLAEARGARFRYGAEVAGVTLAGGRAAGVRLASGEQLDADAVVVNADAAAVAAGVLGTEAAHAVPPAKSADRSLSAVTWALVAETEGFPLLRHTVFFGPDYAGEFSDIFGRGRLPQAPTVYVCAQDRGADDDAPPAGPERLLVLVNAPPLGDAPSLNPSETARCEERAFTVLERCGLRVHRRPELTATTTPAGFNQLFPATGGALYGPASHGWTASFRRPGSRTAVPGLYLAGGSVHPGPGVPMAALSGRLAVASLLSDRASTSRSRGTATPGGTWTRSATTGATASR